MSKKRNIVRTFFETVYGVLTPDKEEQANKSQQAYRSFRAKAQTERSASEVFADWITGKAGTISFVFLHVILFSAWLLINLGYIPGVEPFDPFPFGLLTTIVSLEAIFLAIFVLISQNRESQVSNLREEVDFQINLQAEQEITKLIKMTYEIHEHLGLAKKQDKELEEMKKKLNPEKIEEEIKEEEGGEIAKNSQ